MAILRVDSPKNTDAFMRLAAAVGCPLPWERRDDGCLYDAQGHAVVTPDPLSRLDDDEARALGEIILLAVNTCGGFMAVGI